MINKNHKGGNYIFMKRIKKMGITTLLAGTALGIPGCESNQEMSVMPIYPAHVALGAGTGTTLGILGLGESALEGGYRIGELAVRYPVDILTLDRKELGSTFEDSFLYPADLGVKTIQNVGTTLHKTGRGIAGETIYSGYKPQNGINIFTRSLKN